MRIHPLVVRITHWTNAVAMTVMIGSGWQIYNASPLFRSVFPGWLTLGGWLGGALAWHFAAMWLLAGNFAIYLGYGLASGHIRRRLFPLYPREIWRDAMLALRFRLPHDSSRYNAVQRLLYVLASCGIAFAIVSGLAIWKPVQFYPLTFALGGYEIARRVHFLAMAGIVAFVMVHLALVAIVPRTLRPMLTGRV
ncbi:MAG TPA: cytochrome b/b6 domain-containing protein [Acetobacteraceae bacterium]|nr:cytochrome b/b6 domain-containing protein [Acetobacteraceae bacterium]